MSDVTQLVLLTLLAGISMPAGAILAAAENIRPLWLENELRHGVISFGGGALLSAVALILVPEGSEDLSTGWIALFFAAGGVTFMALDQFLSRLKGSVSQLVAMLSDFIPEALALGAAIALGSSSAVLLAGLMALQNLPEGFNSFRELKDAGETRSRTIILAFFGMSLLGPIAGLIGFFWLADHAFAVSGIMLFAAGGILYIIFQDIAPQAKLEKRWAPALGAVAGFLLGMIGHQLTQGG
ncbi:MAG: hypothetical protein P1U86_03655 [Verrucomicrobiales bacterium]|nr:hypothetical protein [Verrucomicrobiales bacterium]